MPHITLIAKATPEQAMSAVLAAADADGFVADVPEVETVRLRAGSVLLAVLFFWVRYVVAEVTMKPDGDGRVRVVMEWRNPWFRGIVGPLLNRGAMKRFARLFERKLTEQGGRVVDPKRS